MNIENLEKLLGKITFIGVFGLAVACSSCSSYGVKTRIGCPPVSPITNYPNPFDLGTHNANEKKGQVYTCKAGLIDIVHVRKSADYTKVFSEKIFNHLINGREKFFSSND